MPESLRKRFEKEGIDKKALAAAIRQRGIMIPLADELHVSLDSFKGYAKTELGLKDVPLLNKIYAMTPRAISREILGAYTDLFKELKAEIKRLTEENIELHRAERKKDAALKASLCEMLSDVEASGDIPDPILRNLKSAVEAPVLEIHQVKQPALPPPAMKDILVEAAEIVERAEGKSISDRLLDAITDAKIMRNWQRAFDLVCLYFTEPFDDEVAKRADWEKESLRLLEAL